MACIYGFQAVVSTELLVDAVQMIPKGRKGDAQFVGDLGRILGFRE